MTGRRASGSRRSTVTRPPTRDRIIDAAIESFARGGFEGTTIAAIAARVGISDAGVLYHFPTKRELFDAVLDVFTRVQADAFRDAVEPGGLEAIERLRVWGSVMESRPDLLALQIVLNAEAIAPDAELHGYWASRHRAMMELLGELFRQGIERGEIRADVDPVYEASALTAHLDGARLQWFYSDHELSIARSFETYTNHLVERIAVRPCPEATAGAPASVTPARGRRRAPTRGASSS